MRHVKTMLKAGTALLIPLAIAGCGERAGGGGDTGTTPPGTPPSASFQSRFGASFASFFDAGNTTDPRDPTASDVPVLNATADPLDN